jgi:hypothetical protein
MNKTYVIDVPSKNFDEMMLTEIYQGNPTYKLKNDSLGFLYSTENDSLSNQIN